MSTRGRPPASAPSRAESQRDRILDAARQCFIEHGFHASIANIAELAQMSPGLIYRYFENKNAIILAIIERQLHDAREDIAALRSDTDVAPLIVELFEAWRRSDPEVMNPVLLLEMSAQASRDPQIAEALASADRVSRADVHIWFKRMARSKGSELGPLGSQVQALALQCFMEGLAVRAVREPEIDRALLTACVQQFVSRVL